MNARSSATRLAAPALVLVLAGCGGDDNGIVDREPMRYEVAVTNLTAAQPLSPAAVIVHEPDYAAFEIGEPASTAVEKLAEGGDNSDLLAEAGETEAVSGTASGAAPVAPGGRATVSVESPASDRAEQRLTVTGMLVNTNDALAAVNGVDISGLETGESLSVHARSYDSGTEANTETAGTMPGPAASGGAQEGFNAARDDIRDAVHAHQGVVTSDDGLATSVLEARHQWDNPVLRVTITRIQ